MKRRDFGCAPGCSVEVTLDLIEGKWKGVILYHLQEGRLRFGELRKRLPRITQRILTKQLRALEDDRLVARLAAQRVPLTVCPLSNLRLRVVDALERHPLRRMLAAGLLVTVNSDDPAYFGGYMNDNFVQTFAATGLGAQQAWQLARNSFEGSFADASAKRGWLEKVDAHFASFA